MNRKLYVLNYFDSLVRHIDVHTEEQFAKFTGPNAASAAAINVYDHLNGDPIDTNHYYNNSKLNYSDFHAQFSSIEPNDHHSPYSDRYQLVDAGEPPSDLIDTTNRTNESGVDYLNRSRDELIDEIEQAQAESLRRYDDDEVRSHRLESVGSGEAALERALFANKFGFLLEVDEMRQGYRRVENRSPFKIYLIVLDFYLDRTNRQLLW